MRKFIDAVVKYAEESPEKFSAANTYQGESWSYLYEGNTVDILMSPEGYTKEEFQILLEAFLKWKTWKEATDDTKLD